MITECKICDGLNHSKREHCQYCGARRIFISTHSYEPLCTRQEYRCSTDISKTIVRALRSDYAFAVTAQ